MVGQLKKRYNEDFIEMDHIEIKALPINYQPEGGYIWEDAEKFLETVAVLDQLENGVYGDHLAHLTVIWTNGEKVDLKINLTNVKYGINLGASALEGLVEKGLSQSAIEQYDCNY